MSEAIEPKQPRRQDARRSRNPAKWRQGTVQEFLGLSDEVAQLARVKSALAVFLQQRRKAKNWSQTAMAERIGSGQSRVAKMEAAHPSVSLDLLIKALLATGATMPDVAAVIATGDPDARSWRGKSQTKRQSRERR
jgi:ribosome-binding protein aMBF1 (putative translation factor)